MELEGGSLPLQSRCPKAATAQDVPICFLSQVWAHIVPPSAPILHHIPSKLPAFRSGTLHLLCAGLEPCEARLCIGPLLVRHGNTERTGCPGIPPHRRIRLIEPWYHGRPIVACRHATANHDALRITCQGSTLCCALSVSERQDIITAV